jgi:hypothetical protein
MNCACIGLSFGGRISCAALGGNIAGVAGCDGPGGGLNSGAGWAGWCLVRWRSYVGHVVVIHAPYCSGEGSQGQ